jgi:hypothetical protein
MPETAPTSPLSTNASPGFDLTEAEKARLRAEEIYRAEVKRELEAKATPDTFAKRAWKAVNSAFVLWCLSSIAVAGITALVTSRQKARDEESKTTELRRRLATEFANRIFEAKEALQVDRLRVEHKATYPKEEIYGEVLAYLNNSYVVNRSDPHDFSAYPEFRTRTFNSLLVEIERTHDAAKGPSCRDAAKTFSSLAIPASLSTAPTAAAVGAATGAVATRAETESAINEGDKVLDTLQANGCLGEAR